MSTKPPTVAIVEDDRDTARLWQRRLVRSGFVVVGNYPGARLAWAKLRLAPPDALILDWELPPGPHGDWLLKQFANRQLPTHIMVVTSHDNGEVQTRAFASGARGFVGKPASLPELEQRLRAMLAGRVPLSTHNGEFLRQQVCTSPCAAWEKLSPQQKRIVELAAEGRGNKEIGAMMGRSKATIETQIQRIFQKLKTRDMKRVIALCAEALPVMPAALQAA